MGSLLVYLNTNLTNYSNAMGSLLVYLNTNLTNYSNAMRGAVGVFEHGFNGLH